MVSTVSTDQLLKSTLLMRKHDPKLAMMFEEVYPAQVTSASEWFSKKFPRQAQVFGCPFLELQESFTSFDKITPLSMNVDFFAAILGGDERMGHQVIYFEPECMFYFYDPKDRIYKPTSEEKLQNLLRAYLVRCAEELPSSVHKLSLFHEFRQDKQVKAVVHRAKSISAADHTFFAVDSPNQRNQGPESYEKLAKYFVQQAFEREPGEILTLTDAFLSFSQFLKRKEMDPIKRPFFKGMVIPIVREEFNVSLRNDLRGRSSPKQMCGWKDLRALDIESVGMNN